MVSDRRQPVKMIVRGHAYLWLLFVVLLVVGDSPSGMVDAQALKTCGKKTSKGVCDAKCRQETEKVLYQLRPLLKANESKVRAVCGRSGRALFCRIHSESPKTQNLERCRFCVLPQDFAEPAAMFDEH